LQLKYGCHASVWTIALSVGMLDFHGAWSP
jgi:hypothetical protein